MSFRRTLSVITVVLTVLALVSALTVILRAQYLDRTVSLLRSNLESVRVGQQIEIDLLAYTRLSDRVVMALFESDLQQELETAKEYVTTEGERQTLLDAEGKIMEVFRMRKSTGTLPAEFSQDIETALSDLRSFVNVNLVQARQLEDDVTRANQIAEQVAIGAAAVLVLYVLAVLAWLGVAFRPLFVIRDAMKAFAAGDRSARAPETGMQELRLIAQQFNEMSDALARQRENQLAFLTSVAHDLRNPIGALKMSTAILDPSRPLPQEQRIREILGVVGRQIDHLNRMIGDLFDAYRIESGNLELSFREIDAREMIRDCYELFRYVSGTHQLSTQVPPVAVRLRCDAGRMSQVLNNLLSNAIKYSPEGGPITIRLEPMADQILIEVCDKGIGIAPEDIPHIFEPFRRTRHAAREIPGVGLGLHVVRRIVEAHHGRIEVESRVGEGSKFKVWIPTNSL